MMKEILIRFIVGGFVVSAFSTLGDLLKPKSFAGLFGAAPAVALATLTLTVKSKGPEYAGIECHSMIAGAVAFFVYASVVSRVMMRYHPKVIWAASGAVALWFGVAFGLWQVWLR